MNINITIVDDHPVVAKGLQQILNEYQQIAICDICRNGDDLLNVLPLRQPDVILLDIQMPGRNGIELTEIIRKEYPKIGILALTNIDMIFQAQKILKNGALGYLLKSANPEMLVKAIETVKNGKQFIDPIIKEGLLLEVIEVTDNSLTLREKEILQLIGSEYTSHEIAEKLFISHRTVENHRLNILSKLGVKNTAGLIKKAIQLGLI